MEEEFRKKAQEFTLEPSSRVWKKVESNIRKRKRVKLAIYLTIIVLLGTSFYLILGIGHFHTSSLPDAFQSSQINRHEETRKINNNQVPASNKPQAHSHKASQYSSPLSVVSSSKNNKEFPAADMHTKKFEPALNKQLFSAGLDRYLKHQETEPLSSIDKKISALIPIGYKGLFILSDTMTIHKKQPIRVEFPLTTTLQKPVPGHRWSLALTVSPILSFSDIRESGKYRFIEKYRDSTDKLLLTAGFSGAVYYQCYPGWEIYAGLGVHQTGQKISTRQVVYQYDSISSGPTISIKVSRKYINLAPDSGGTVFNRFTYAELPVGICYELIPGRNINLVFQTEISIGKLIERAGYYYDYQKKTYIEDRNGPMQDWMLTVGAGLNAMVRLRKELCLGTGLFYRRNLHSVYSGSYPLNQVFRQAELKISLRYHLDH
ncbi:MAG: hypothetical protein NTU44_08150 [Bacteroidetes bacterium]|nr:hypothetical protein [Bacteroidota bacterium]